MKRIASITLAALGFRDRAGTVRPPPPRQEPRPATRPAPLEQSSASPELVQLMGRCHRLQQELEISADAHPPLKARIDRLLLDLAVARREIAALEAAERESEDPPQTE